MAQYFWFNLFVFLNVLMLTLLAMNVSGLRMKEKVAIGDGGNTVVNKAIRAHGNGVEHVVVFGLMLLALELSNAPAGLLATLVVGFTVARVLHAVGMLGPVFKARRAGAAATYLLAIVAVFAVLVYGILM